MDFPLNQTKLDPSYISSVEDDTESTILAQYTLFKELSTILVKAFNREKETYGSQEQLPEDILKKYNRLFTELFDEFKNLREDLQRQVNRNSKLLEEIFQKEGPEFFFYEIALRKQEKLQQKIEYFRIVNLLYIDKFF